MTESVKRTWVGDEDTPENQIFIPPVKRQFKAEPPPADGSPAIETYTEGLEDEKPQLPVMPKPEPKPDIDKAIAERQPKSRLTPVQMKRRSRIGDIGYKWGYILPPIPKDLSDEEIDAYLDWLYDDVQRHIRRKKRGW